MADSVIQITGVITRLPSRRQCNDYAAHRMVRGLISGGNEKFDCCPQLQSGCNPPPSFLRKPPTKWVSGVLFRGIKRPEHAVDHSPPATFEIKNVWRCTITIPLCLHGVLENILSSKTAVIVVKILGAVVQNITIRGLGILCTLVLQDSVIEGETFEIFAALRISNHCLLFWQRKFGLNY